jgi:hypothetical protein
VLLCGIYFEKLFSFGKAAFDNNQAGVWRIHTIFPHAYAINFGLARVVV